MFQNSLGSMQKSKQLRKLLPFSWVRRQQVIGLSWTLNDQGRQSGRQWTIQEFPHVDGSWSWEQLAPTCLSSSWISKMYHILCPELLCLDSVLASFVCQLTKAGIVTQKGVSFQEIPP